MKLPHFASMLGCLIPGLVVAAEFNPGSATNQVGLALYQQLSTARPTGNLVISPYSIESALALVYAGAGGATRAELERALHFPSDLPTLQRAFGQLREDLEQIATRSAQAAKQRRERGGELETVEWHAASRLFGQSDYAFRGPFLTLLQEGFAAPLDRMDFRRDAESARKKINTWVEAQTHEKIRDLIPDGGLSADTRLVLVNALYLKAPWQTPFEPTATRPGPFHLANGTLTDVPTMRKAESMGYAREGGLTIVADDFLGGELRFLIILPPAGQPLETAIAQIRAEDFARWARLGREIPATLVELQLPRFRIAGATVPLGQALRGLGVTTAFDEPAGSADFDPMAPRRGRDGLALSQVYHQTFVAVDEAGTEAAAATAPVMFTLSAMADPPKPVKVHADRPFLFALQHRASGACLFLGRVTDPR